jgi:hypothetical protein
MGEFDYTHGKQQIARTVRVRKLLEKQGYSSTVECGLILDLRGIPGCKTTPRDARSRIVAGCKVTPGNVVTREPIMQNSPSETMTDCYLHASDPQLTNWRGQEINDTAQVFNPCVDENDDYFVNYPAGELSGVKVPVGDTKLPGVDTDFDAEPTGVEMDTGAYGKAYDAVPQEQGNMVKVDGLGQQDPTKAQIYKGKKHKIALTQVKHKVALTQVITLLLKLVMLVTLTGTTMAQKSIKALPTKRGGAVAELAMDNETLHWHKVTGKQKEQVLGFHILVDQKRDRNITAHKVIGGKEQRNHVTKGDVSSPMVLEEAGMPAYFTNAQEERDVAVSSIPNTCVQTVTSDDYKANIPSKTDGCNKECLISVRSEAMKLFDGLQVTQKSQSREMEWRLRCSHWRAINIGIGRGVNNKSHGTYGSPKQPKHNNISVIDGTGEIKCILGTDKRVSVGCKIPGVSLGYNKIRGVKVAVKLIVLDSKIDYDNVGDPTGVYMHAIRWQGMKLC